MAVCDGTMKACDGTMKARDGTMKARDGTMKACDETMKARAMRRPSRDPRVVKNARLYIVAASRASYVVLSIHTCTEQPLLYRHAADA